VGEKAAERRAIGDEDGEVVEAQPAARWHRTRAPEFPQFDERPGRPALPQDDPPVCLLQNSKSDHACVISGRSLEVRHLEDDLAGVG
jgi:hypothetical protein